MVAIDVDREGKPRDEKLGAAVQAFAEKQLGSKIVFPYYLRVWAILAIREDDEDYFEVVGVTSLRNSPDCPLFHIAPLTSDKAGLKLAEQARDLAVYRMHSYLQDAGLSGGTVLIYVSETAQRYWRRFLKRIKAKPANRFEMRI